MSPPPADEGSTPPAADSAGQIRRLAPECDASDVDPEARYVATVSNIVDYGVFVDLNPAVSGLIHESNIESLPELEAEIVVELIERRENGDLAFAPVDAPADGEVVEQAPDYDTHDVDRLDSTVGETVHIEGEVVQIKQTGGPTIFTVSDGEAMIPCAAFEDAGIRAYPEVEEGAAVHAMGTVERRQDGYQVELEILEVLDGERAAAARDAREAALKTNATPPSVDPLVDWAALETFSDDLDRVARRLRRAVLEGRPIRIRHHADGDGMCASVPVELALRAYLEEVSLADDPSQYAVRRSPSKAPFYEMEDAIRDLNHALGDRERHGQRMPVLLMIDNGSTAEDVPAYRTLDRYDIPMMVIDHHHPDEAAIGDLLDEHVNPYLHGEDYRITAGMLCVELARRIHPEIEADIRHLPAIAGIADRSGAEAMANYIELARQEGYDVSDLRDVSEALDYLAHWLRYDPGTHLVADVLNLRHDTGRHREIVRQFATGSREAVAEQLAVAGPHVERRELANGAVLQLADLEDYARRFTYPAPGKTTGELHDRAVEESGDPVITVGYGPDFAVLRSDGVRLDIPRTVSDLDEALPGAGVRGGGHLVVGSIKFVKGMRETVIEALVDEVADATIDPDIGAGGTVDALE